MEEKPKTGRNLSGVATRGVFLAVILAAVWFFAVKDKAFFKTQAPVAPPAPERIPIHPLPVIDYSQIDKNAELQALMKSRKTEYGVFNVGQTLDLFKQIDYRQFNRVRFDGKYLSIPAEQ